MEQYSVPPNNLAAAAVMDRGVQDTSSTRSAFAPPARSLHHLRGSASVEDVDVALAVHHGAEDAAAEDVLHAAMPLERLSLLAATSSYAAPSLYAAAAGVVATSAARSVPPLALPPPQQAPQPVSPALAEILPRRLAPSAAALAPPREAETMPTMLTYHIEVGAPKIMLPCARAGDKGARTLEELRAAAEETLGDKADDAQLEVFDGRLPQRLTRGALPPPPAVAALVAAGMPLRYSVMRGSVIAAVLVFCRIVAIALDVLSCAVGYNYVVVSALASGVVMFAEAECADTWRTVGILMATLITADAAPYPTAPAPYVYLDLVGGATVVGGMGTELIALLILATSRVSLSSSSSSSRAHRGGGRIRTLLMDAVPSAVKHYLRNGARHVGDLDADGLYPMAFDLDDDFSTLCGDLRAAVLRLRDDADAAPVIASMAARLRVGSKCFGDEAASLSSERLGDFHKEARAYFGVKVKDTVRGAAAKLVDVTVATGIKVAGFGHALANCATLPSRVNNTLITLALYALGSLRGNAIESIKERYVFEGTLNVLRRSGASGVATIVDALTASPISRTFTEVAACLVRIFGGAEAIDLNQRASTRANLQSLRLDAPQLAAVLSIAEDAVINAVVQVAAPPSDDVLVDALQNIAIERNVEQMLVDGFGSQFLERWLEVARDDALPDLAALAANTAAAEELLAARKKKTRGGKSSKSLTSRGGSADSSRGGGGDGDAASAAAPAAAASAPDRSPPPPYLQAAPITRSGGRGRGGVIPRDDMGLAIVEVEAEAVAVAEAAAAADATAAALDGDGDAADELAAAGMLPPTQRAPVGGGGGAKRRRTVAPKPPAAILTAPAPAPAAVAAAAAEEAPAAPPPPTPAARTAAEQRSDEQRRRALEATTSIMATAQSSGGGSRLVNSYMDAYMAAVNGCLRYATAAPTRQRKSPRPPVSSTSSATPRMGSFPAPSPPTASFASSSFASSYAAAAPSSAAAAPASSAVAAMHSKALQAVADVVALRALLSSQVPQVPQVPYFPAAAMAMPWMAPPPPPPPPPSAPFYSQRAPLGVILAAPQQPPQQDAWMQQLQQQQEDMRQQQEDMRRQKEDMQKQQEDMRKQQEDVRKQQEDLRQQKEARQAQLRRRRDEERAEERARLERRVAVARADQAAAVAAAAGTAVIIAGLFETLRATRRRVLAAVADSEAELMSWMSATYGDNPAVGAADAGAGAAAGAAHAEAVARDAEARQRVLALEQALAEALQQLAAHDAAVARAEARAAQGWLEVMEEEV